MYRISQESIILKKGGIMSQLTRQEVQRLLDTTRNQITDRVLTRQDLITVNEQIRDRMMNYMQDLAQVQQQNIVRRTASQSDDVSKRIVALESRICNMEQDLKTTLQILQKLTSQKQSHVDTVMQRQQKNYNHTPEQRYVYGVN